MVLTCNTCYFISNYCNVAIGKVTVKIDIYVVLFFGSLIAMFHRCMFGTEMSAYMKRDWFLEIVKNKLSQYVLYILDYGLKE